ncbi:hypothetical protein RHGRI_008773 [Rhododendron griersonianum]|uniref:Uncharacterized protein n=1 Tax=Rhododendron griersonianum TaxID=479676 RepID=A0AAV6L1S1_9ERIC|nr:hypothetical protein RHGRI_008773 [Rhododendron griersonianum]
MMALGFMGNSGSSSSSSNLSPLAPPFTVDRSNPKPNSNPLVPFTEPSYAALPFQSSYHNWQYPDSSYNEYGYLGSQSVSSTNAHMPPLNPSVTTATDAFAFHQYSSENPKNCVLAEPNYSPSVSPAGDNAIPLVALNEPSYDVLPTSCGAALGGNSQVDYTRSLSGLEYMPSWSCGWNNRLADKETNCPGSYVCKEYITQGPSTAHGPSKCNEVSAISRESYVNVWGRRSQFVTPSSVKLNESSSPQDPMFIPTVSERTSFSGTSSTLQDSHLQGPSLQLATDYCFHQNPYFGSYDKCFPSLDSCMKDFVPVKKNSPALVIRPPSSSASSKMPNAATSEGLAINNKNFGRHNPSNQKEPLLSSSDGKSGCLDSSGPILHMERSNHIFNASPSPGKEVLSYTTKTGKEFKLPDINVPYGFSLELDNSKGLCSAEYSCEGLDNYNLAVDSPCWKGATASCFYPSEASEAITPETHICPPCADDSVKVSCPYICGNSEYKEDGYVELGSLLCPERLSNAICPTGEQTSFDVVKAGLIYPGSSSSNDVQFSNDFNNDLPNGPKSDSLVKLSHAKQPDLGRGDFIPERESKMRVGVADSGLKTKDASKDGTVSFHGMESTSFSPCSGENIDKLVKMHATESRPKLDVKILVDTIRNLSELLLFQCSNDSSAVSEENHEVLKRVINNLDTCVSKRIVDMTPTLKSVFTQQCTSSHQCGNLPDSDKGVIAGRPPVTKEEVASSQGPFDHDSAHEVKRNRDISGKVVEKFSDSFSLRGNADNVKDDNMVQAIKGVLEKDFPCEEETQPETVLYKNLWLEAEAALCSMSYRARFNHVAECSMAVDKLLNSKVSPNPNATQKVILQSEDSPLSDNNINDSPISSATKVVDDVEASALARFQILKCRAENSNSITAKGRYDWPLLGDPTLGGSLDVTVEPSSQYSSVINNKRNEFGSYIGQFDYETMKELDVCAADDQGTQSCGNNRFGGWLPSGWCDGSSLDWEDVRKDEFASQN